MSRTLEKLESRHDAAANLVAAHDLQLVEIQREKRTRSEHSWALYVVTVTVVLSSLGQIVALILTSQPHR